MAHISRSDDRLPFRDRAAAGRILAERLDAGALGLTDPTRPPPDDGTRVVVLGIPRGGVPVAAAIARRVGARLDVLVAHKVGAPGQADLAIGAVAADGSVRREPWSRSYATDGEFRVAAALEIERARARAAMLRAGRPAVPLDGVTAVLVDDGIATGSTMLIAVEAARRAGAARVVVAVPVAAEQALEALVAVADAVVAVAVPRDFRSVGTWYEHFDQVDDETVRMLLGGLASG